MFELCINYFHWARTFSHSFCLSLSPCLFFPFSHINKLFHSNAAEWNANKAKRKIWKPDRFCQLNRIDFSSQFIIKIYLHGLIEWFALTNLITKFDRKAKLSRFNFSPSLSRSLAKVFSNILNKSHAFGPSLQTLSIHSKFKNANKQTVNLCIWSIA